MKKPSKLPLIISIVAAVFSLALVTGVIFVITTFFRGSSDRSNSYSAAVRMVESAQKNFTVGETAAIGPYDVTSSINNEYIPSETELQAVEKVFDRAKRSSSSRPTDYYGYSLTPETGRYALVTLNLKYNENRSGYDDVSVSLGDWTNRFSEATLSGMMPLIANPDTGDYKASKGVVTAAKTAEGATLTLLYRVAQAKSTLALEYDITIFTKVSPIVGTEGMPSKEFKYTIGIQ